MPGVRALLVIAPIHPPYPPCRYVHCALTSVRLPLQMLEANTTIEDILLASLASAGFNLTTTTLNSPTWLSRPVFLQYFESTSLRRLGARSCLPLILLLGSWKG